MKVVENSFDRLTLRAGTPLVALIFAVPPLVGLWWVAARPEMFDSDGQRWLVGAVYALFAAIAWWAFPRTTLVMDRREGIAAISERRIGGRRINPYRLEDIERVAVLNIARKGRALAPHLIVGGDAVPILRRSLSEARAYRVQRLIEDWLTRAA